MESEVVPEEALLSIAEQCILTPQTLANLLIERSDAEQIFYAHPNDRKEQLYQILLRWKQANPLGTWIQLRTTTDSGIGHVMRSMSRDDCVEEVTTAGGASDRIRFDERKPLETPTYFTVGMRIEEEIQPSAPPYSLTQEYVPCQRDTNISDRLLTPDNFPEVLEAVHYENNWYELGLALRIPDPILDEIQRNNMRQVAECRKELLRKWLRQLGTIKPSWRSLCQALRNPIVGNNGLANRIAQYHRIM